MINKLSKLTMAASAVWIKEGCRQFKGHFHCPHAAVYAYRSLCQSQLCRLKKGNERFLSTHNLGNDSQHLCEVALRVCLESTRGRASWSRDIWLIRLDKKAVCQSLESILALKRQLQMENTSPPQFNPLLVLLWLGTTHTFM